MNLTFLVFHEQCTTNHYNVQLYKYQFSKMKFYEFLALTTNRDELLNYLYSKNVIRQTIKCPQCGSILELKCLESLCFHCTNHYYKQITNRKRKRLTCNFKISALHRTWFSKANLNIGVACRLICYILMMNTPRQRFLEVELNISSSTAVDWTNFCREVIKYNRGRVIQGQWIFGAIERHSKKFFVVPIASRKSEVLLPLILKNIAPGTIIYSDCWKAYAEINKDVYKHYTVNHSANFVDPETGVHTQNIERLWREIRGNIPLYGRKECHFNYYLAEFIFKKKFDFSERLDAFFKIMGIMYPLNESLNE
ncbi:uncharacterized protein LOC117611040 [Osmia lignaria lignaria]|uniref:uncharacterized protein LOC117611040 n=1 Tax=Osmia lignaria lignaria TaxID=1437193 RepID=UPI00402BEE02